ncbi:ImmA/IrrE family metallo-endopeptidase [Erythrobacter dokdonensis]|uniref:LtrC-like protein n=1 Tax=Erythrobacter dokdonensis DSW-74 TaxID=1300349 RepID=A0A1A7BDH4_9SPHN|nr:hypothetical protein [Erythrobacter dokdonensis]OBV10544.1 LtrC-like protein [Erythrobacter dokdonensis DSW-74]
MVELLFGLACLAFVVVGIAYLEARRERPASEAESAVSPISVSQSVIDRSTSVPAAPSSDETTGDDPLAVDGLEHQGSEKNRLRELMGIALTAPTPDAIMEFSAFASRLRHLGPYNIYMIFAQRPGAKAVASRKDWARVGQTVRPDAMPILILRPKGPITQVFELEDTLPQRDKDPRHDVFAAVGEFKPTTLGAAIKSLASSKKRNLKVEVVLEDLGSNRAGQITAQPSLPLSPDEPLQGEPELKALTPGAQAGHWRVKLNRRLTDAEKFATLLHELGHLFCGHVGAFDPGKQKDDEYGWPDRSRLPYRAKEVEAELVSWHICERWGLTTGSALYLRPYMERAEADVRQVDLDRVIRAIARIEQFIPRRPPPSKLPRAPKA